MTTTVEPTCTQMPLAEWGLHPRMAPLPIDLGQALTLPASPYHTRIPLHVWTPRTM